MISSKKYHKQQKNKPSNPRKPKKIVKSNSSRRAPNKNNVSKQDEEEPEGIKFLLPAINNRGMAVTMMMAKTISSLRIPGVPRTKNAKSQFL
jgi:hypothetical protein